MQCTWLGSLSNSAAWKVCGCLSGRVLLRRVRMAAPDVRCKRSHLKRWPCFNVCICLSGSHGAPGWGLGAGDAKIWQIAENCLHTVIPVWTHLAHLDGIWQQKEPWRRAQLTEWCHILTLSPPSPTLFCLWGARSWAVFGVMLGSCPAGAFPSSSLTWRLSQGGNWSDCRGDGSTMTLQALHVFKGEKLHTMWKL